MTAHAQEARHEAVSATARLVLVLSRAFVAHRPRQFAESLLFEQLLGGRQTTFELPDETVMSGGRREGKRTRHSSSRSWQQLQQMSSFHVVYIPLKGNIEDRLLLTRLGQARAVAVCSNQLPQHTVSGLLLSPMKLCGILDAALQSTQLA